MTKQEVKSFRGDFQKTVAQLEAQYGVNISLGTIRFDEIIKINNKNIKVKAINVGEGQVGGLINVTPSILVKK